MLKMSLNGAKKVAAVFAAVAVVFGALSCSDNVGLGESVDTEAPKLVITYPPASAVIKDSFVFAGTWSDDKGVKSIAVTVKNSSSETAFTGNADVASDGTWQITLNDYDAESSAYYNGWQLADGTYEVSAVASDSSGHTSSSVSRSFTIDNTAPVLVLTKPTTVGTNTAKSYGQQVQLLGTFSEMSEGKINLLTVTFYKTDGTVKHESNFENISEMSSANPLTIAQYYDEDSREGLSDDDLAKWENYKQLYSAWEDFDENSGSEQTYFTVTAYDVAKIYQTVGDSGTGSGNATSSYYRGTTNMLTLIEGKNSTFSGFSVLSLRNYLNGTDTTYSSDSTTQAALETILSAARSVSLTSSDGDLTADDIARTSTDSGNVFLAFQVNPNNNPKFTASGYAIDESKADGSSYSTSANGAAGYKLYSVDGPIILGVTPGLDETNIDTSTVSVYAVDATVDADDLDEGYAENKVLVWTWNEAVAVSYAAGKSLTDSTDKEYQTALALVEEDSDSYRYTITSSDENTDSLSQEASLSESDVTLTKPYYLYVEGADIDGQSIVNYVSAGYGIWPNTTAAAPEIAIGTTDEDSLTNLADEAVINKGDFKGGLTFSGTATSANVELSSTAPLTYTVTLTSASDSTKTASVTGALEYTLDSELPYVYSWSLALEPDTAMAELLETEGRYSLALTVYANNTAGMAKEKRTFIVDNKAPTVSNLSISDSVTSNSVVYINPAYVTSYTLSGNSIDNYELASTTYTIIGVDSAGAEKTLTETLDDSSEWTVKNIDLSGFAAQDDASDIVVAVTALDSAGNESSEVTLALEIDAAAPTITLTAGSSSSTWNKSTALTVSGTTSDDGSGATTVYYKLNDADDYTSLAVASNKFSTNETFNVGTNTLSYYVVDAVGNASDVEIQTVQIDTAAPTVSELSSTSSDYTAFTAQKFGNSTDGMTFAFLVYDADSNIDTDSIDATIDIYTISKSITTYGTVTVTEQPVTLTTNESGTITGLTAVSSGTSGSVTGYKVVFELRKSLGENLTESNLYTVTATVPDIAGNIYTPQIGILTLDKTPPKVTVTKVSGSASYVNGVKQISVIVQESSSIASVSYEIFNATDTSFASPLSFYPVTAVTDSTPTFSTTTVSSAAIDDPETSISFYVCTSSNNASAFSGVESFVVRITATDSAGNSNRDYDGTANESAYAGISSTYIIDTVAPVLETDKINGSVYDAENASSNWYNSTTLPLSGTWTETGSGVAAMYYLRDGSDDISTSNYTGIAYPDSDGEYSVNVSGFDSGTHTLQYLAVDNAGNASSIVTHTVSVDVTAPSITATNSETKTISASAADSEISFTSADGSATESGLDISTLVVKIGDNQLAVADATSTGTTTSGGVTTYTYTLALGTVRYTITKDSDGLETYNVTVTPSNTALVSEDNSNALSSGSTYNVQAYVYDAAGNVSTTKTVYTFTVDTTAPTVKITGVSGTEKYIKDTKSITVNISDAGTISTAEWALFSYDSSLTSYESATALASGTSVAEPDTVLTATDGFEQANAATVTMTIDISSISSLEDGSQFVVCVRATDEAGNTSTYSGNAVSSVYTVDTIAPALSDDTLGGITPATDSSKASAWLNATTLAAAGTLTDSGSGVSTLYYQLVAAGAESTTAMTVANYASAGTAVAISGSSFNQNITGFTASTNANTVRYVVVDAVGNVSDLYTRYVWIDNVAPVVEEASSEDGVITSFDTVTTVSTATTSKTFKAIIYDAASGIDSSTLKVVIASGSSTFTIPDSDNSSYGTLSYDGYSGTEENTAVTGYTVTTTITSTLIGKLTDGKQYTVTLTGEDVAGNSVSQLISYLKVDTASPVITINGSAAYVNGDQSITVKLTDSSDIAAIDWKVCAYDADATDYKNVTAVTSSETGVTSGSVASSDLGYTVSITVPFGNDVYTDGLAYVLCVQATDDAGNVSEYAYDSSTGHKPYSAAYTVDKSAPSLSGATIGGETAGGLSANSWFKKSTLALAGTLSDSASGAETLYYLVDSSDSISTSNYTGTAKLTAGTTGTWTFSQNITLDDGSSHTVQYLAEDALGNVSSVLGPYTFSVDATAPEITASSSSPLVNSAATATLEAISLSDATSGISSIVWTAGSLSYTSTGDDSSSYFTVSNPDSSYSVTLTADAIEALVPAANKTSTTVTVKATVTDMAGNSTSANVGTISVDNTPPTVTLATASTYWVKDSLSFTVTATDTNGIASTGSYVVYAYTNSTLATTETTKGTFTFTDGSATVTIDDSNETIFTNEVSYKVVVTVTDSVDNTGEATSNAYTIDRTPPAISSVTVGTDTAYSVTSTDDVSSWGTETTLTVGGTWIDSASGAATVYYQYVAKTDTDTTEMTAANYSTTASGSVSLSGSSTAGYSFTTNLRSLTDGYYTLCYVAVDAVGNVSEVVKRIFGVDQTAPTSSGTPATTLTNKEPTSALSVGSGVTFSDATSGLSYAEVTAGSVSLGSSADTDSIISLSSGTVIVTLSADTFTEKLSSLSGYVSVTATVYDAAGNSSSAIIGTLNIDTTAPTVTVTKVSGTNAYIYQTKELTVNLSDANNVDSAAYAIYATSDTSYANVLASGDLATTDHYLTATDFEAGETASTVTFTIDISEISSLTNASTFVVAITATDGAENTSTTANGLSSTYTVDSKEPTFDASSSGGSATTIGSSSYTASSWYKETSLSVAGSWTEAGSGIAAVYYQVVAADSENVTAMTNTNYSKDGIATGSFSTTDKGNYENFSTSLSGFAATKGNMLYLVAVDNVGLASKAESFTINVDQVAPEIKAYTASDESDTTDYSLTGTTITNGSSDVSLKFVATDDDSGVSAITATINGTSISYGTESTYGSIAYDRDTGLVTLTIANDLLGDDDFAAGYYPVTVTVTDAAGMSASSSVRTLNVDKTAPTVKISSPTSGSVNKTITVSGTATDTNGVESVTVWASTSSTASASDTGSVPSGTVTVSDDGTWSTTLNTSTLYNDASTAVAYIYASATDSVGNESTASSSAGSIATVTVNQNADRPTVKVTNLTNNGTTASPDYVLLYGTDAQIAGTVSDDDSTSSAVVAAFVASSSKLTEVPTGGSDGWTVTTGTDSITFVHETYGTTVFTPSTGDWTYTPADTSDGAKYVYFLVQDNETNGVQTEFYTGSDSTLTQPYFQCKTETASSNSAYITYQSNSGAPSISSVMAQAYYAVDTTTYTANGDATTVSNALIVGGTSKQYVTFVITASDNNGVASMSLSVNGTTYVTGSEGMFTATTNSTSTTWTTDTYIDLSSLDSGTQTATVIVYDTSGLYSSATYYFTVDNEGPTVTVTSPSSTDEQTGSIAVIGTASDSAYGVSSIKYLIPTAAQRTAAAAASDAAAYWYALGDDYWSDNISSGYTVTAWQFDFDGTNNPLLSGYDTSTYYLEEVSDGIYTIPLYFLAEDGLGNYTVNTDYYITHNPDGDRPVTEISYPTDSDYDTDESFITLSGTVRVNGTVEIPSLTCDVGQAYLQIGTVASDGTITWSSSNSALTSEFSTLGGVVTPTATYTLTSDTTVDDSKTYYTLSGTTYTAVTSASDDDIASYYELGYAIGDTYTSTTYVDSTWWGIKATTKTSTWNISLNTNGKLDPSDSDSTTNIAVRACAINENGKMGSWTNTYYIHVDSNAPNQSAEMRQYSSFSSSALDENVTTTKDYASEMYLKGTWYLVVKLSDNDSLLDSSISIKQGSTTVTSSCTFGSKHYVYTDGTDVTTANSEKTLSSVYMYVYIPVVTISLGSSVSYVVYATDTSGHSSSMTYTFKIDNTAPTLGTVSGNGTELSTSAENSVAEYNYVYTFTGDVTDSASGYNKVAFYFLRDGYKWDNSTGKASTTDSFTTSYILDPLVTSWRSTADSKVTFSGLTKMSSVTGEANDVLYAATATGDAITASTTDGTTYYSFTDSGSVVSGNNHIHAGGLIYAGGAYGLITSVKGSTVTFTSDADATGETTVYFPYAQVVDNTSTEDVSGTTANPFTFSSGDDGDLMPESITNVSTTWTWKATIHSSNIPDGPAYLVVVAYDEAGNVSTATYPVNVANSAPRLAKLYLGTDLNSDSSWASSEFNSYNVYTADTDAGVDTTGYKTSASITTANFDAGQFTAKDKLAVVPEITGGNGSLYMVYKEGATGTTAVTGTTGGSDSSGAQLVSSTSLDVATSTSASYLGVLNSGDSLVPFTLTSAQVWQGLTADPSSAVGVSFTFWDSTEERTAGTDSQYCVAYVTDMIIDLADGTAPTNVIDPFYWNSLTDNSIYGSDSITYPSQLSGHIELESDLTSSIKTSYGGDPKVSGKIKITGTAYDDKMLQKITLSASGFSFGDTAGADFTFATFDGSEWTLTSGGTSSTEGGAIASDGWQFQIDRETLTQSGHTITWTLYLDTETHANIAATDVVVLASATDFASKTLSGSDNNSDATSTTQTTSSSKTCYYKMDVMPYIQGVKTSLSSLKKANSSVYDRTALGHYPLSASANAYFYGFNLSGGTLYDSTGETSVALSDVTDATSESWYSSSATYTQSPATIYSAAVSTLTSGEVTIRVNGVPSLNNMNDNSASGSYTTTTTSTTGDYTVYANYYNRQPNNDSNNLLTDDVVLDVWAFDSDAVVPISGKIEQPHMAIDPVTGQIGFAFVNGPLYFSMAGSTEDSKKTSYDYWMGSYDFFTSVGFAYDSLGYTYGVAAGGDINSASADKFQLMTSRWGRASRAQNGSYSSSNSLRLESIGLRGTKSNTTGTTYYFDKQRIKSPSLATAVHGSNTNLYLAYYDAMNDELRFKAGNTGDYAYQEGYTSYVRRIERLDGTGWRGVWVKYVDDDGNSMYNIKNNDYFYLCDKDGNVTDTTRYYFAGYYTGRQEDLGLVAFTCYSEDGTVQVPPPGITTDIINNADDLVDNQTFKVLNDDVYIKIVPKYNMFESFVDFDMDGAPYPYRNDTVSMIAGDGTDYGAGSYVSLGVVPGATSESDVVVAVWYDEDSRVLRYSYNTTPLTNRNGTTDRSGWSTPVQVFSGDVENAGEYCQLVVDANGGIHIAAYDSVNCDLVYAYLSSYKATPVTCVVDSSGVVGSNLTIDVALDSNNNAIPRIGYYATSCVRPKLAYRVDTSSTAPAGASDDAFTGAWECAILPTSSSVSTQSNQYNKMNVGVWKDASTGVVTSSASGTSTYTNDANSYSSTSYGFVYGNGTSNAVMGYAIKVSSSTDAIETAQMQ